MADINLYRCTPRQIRGFILDCCMAGVVPFVQSSPGMGKSSIMRSIAKETNLFLKDHRLSTSPPEDLSGLPRFDEDGFARFAPFADLFPVESTPIPDGYDGWMVFLDEFNSAKKDTQAAAYKLILDKMVGQYRLHERVVLTAAGNLSTDKAITNNLGTAMQSRVVHLEMEISHQEWMEDVAFIEDYDPRIIAFLNYRPEALMDFDPNHQEKTFACPRTWEFMNRLIKDKEVSEEKTPLYAGTLTSGIAVEFVQFTKIQASMVDVKDILRDPTGCVIPSDNAARWMVISHMMSKVTDKNFEDLCTYANRFDLTFRVIFFRSAMVRHPELRGHPAFAKAMIELNRYLNGPLQQAA